MIRLAVVGDMPGKWDAQYGRIFSGPAGKLLDGWWATVGLDRHTMWLGNLFEEVRDPKKIKKEELEKASQRLRDALALGRPCLVVPMGQLATNAVLGPRMPSITRVRGSIYRAELLGGTKVIPTLHPSSVLRDPTLGYACLQDWRRIAVEQQTPEIDLPEVVSDITPTILDIEEWVKEAFHNPTPCALDIETSKELLCVGLSRIAGRALVVPLTRSSWTHAIDHARVIAALCRLVGEHPQLVAHNGLFDFWWLAKEWGVMPRFWWDTQAMAHALDSHGPRGLLPNSLHYLASIHTRHPYWKDEGKEAGVGKTTTRDWRGLLTYCGKDAAVTLELHGALLEKLEESSHTSFYLAHYQNLLPCLLDLSLRGLRIDAEIRATALEVRKQEIQEFYVQLEALAGHPLHVTSGLSGQKVALWLYGKPETGGLGAPKKFHRGSGALTTEGLALKKLMFWASETLAGRCAKSTPKYLREPARLRQIRDGAKLLLRARKLKNELDYYTETRIDPDGRLRCTYTFKTESGSLASRENPLKTGANLHLVPRHAKAIVVPEPGHLFLGVELSQVESRIVGCLSGDPVLIERAMSTEHDHYKSTAAMLFEVDASKLSGKQVQIARYVIRAAHYGMPSANLAELLALGGVAQAQGDCERMTESYLKRHSAVREWHAKLRRQVLQEGGLTNSWGRRIDFSLDRFDVRAWSAVYSWLPQSEASDLLIQWGLIMLHREIKRRGFAAKIAMQVQNLLLVDCLPEEAYDLACMLGRSLSRPRVIGRAALSVPVRWRIGTSWLDGIDLLSLPSREVFTQQAFAAASGEMGS